MAMEISNIFGNCSVRMSKISYELRHRRASASTFFSFFKKFREMFELFETGRTVGKKKAREDC